jgi:hypothetical protein
MSRPITDGDPEWPTARLARNLSVDHRPAFVVQIESAAEVAEVVCFARANGLRVAPQCTDHNPAPLGDLSTTILLPTDLLREVTVDVHARTVRIGAGVVWGDVTAALAPHGLPALAGSSVDVGRSRICRTEAARSIISTADSWASQSVWRPIPKRSPPSALLRDWDVIPPIQHR